MMQYVGKKLTWRVSYLFRWLVDFLIFFFIILFLTSTIKKIYNENGNLERESLILGR
jgi:hypothetical protein